jgi:protein-tyrosine-phosphatase
MTGETTTLPPPLAAYLEKRLTEIDGVSHERRVLLRPLVEIVAERMARNRPVRLMFICTHNSRRSHMAQLWAQVAAELHGVVGVETYSGGTEATAFNPRAVAALQRAGFVIEPFTDGKNPTYEVSFGPGITPMQAFSKIYQEAPNPREDFVAVMTCASADAACPVIQGADARISLPYDDPKASDGTVHDTKTYDERCAQIAREMLWVFSEIVRTF